MGILAAIVGASLAGPVAALLLGGYTAVGARALLHRVVGRAEARYQRRALDVVVSLAADLRAGLPLNGALDVARERLDVPPSGALGTARDRLDVPLGGALETARERGLRRQVAEVGGPLPALGSVTADDRVRAAWRLAERSGAPLADILDLVVLDLREEQSRRAQTNAQLAGARATMGILTVLPAVGLGLGYAIGGDPLAVLLHTSFGAVCAVLTLLFQSLGLVWVGRLVRHASA
ncbi:type II secretion system F family protein [Longispora sp. NPDC051575]|uniref:type II secretion system F family protein n=1 Tax=Longispora sp. NPDC051575 TaxID=3154943 RepID=UPI00342CF721